MRIVAFLFALFLPSVAWAEWTVTARESLESSPGSTFTLIRVADGSRSAEVLAISAKQSSHSLAVIDDPAGVMSVAKAGETGGAIAAANGGYFHPDRTPLGLLIAAGRVIHPFEKARLLSGVALATDERVSLLRVLEDRPTKGVKSAVQAGPFLVDHGKPVAGLEATRSAARTLLFTSTKGGSFGIALCRYATLAETGEILAIPNLIEDRPIERALNLDGGTSSGLWVRQDGSAFSIREFKSVRNFVAIVPK